MSLLVVGLGNPGRQYENTRHNVGFWVIERLAEKLNITLKKKFLKAYEMGEGHVSGGKIILARPLTYMNNSGNVIRDIIKRAGVGTDKMLVVCDHLDLPPGSCRLRLKGSSGGHKGLQSIIDNLGKTDFMRIYIGIGRPESRENVIEYVLGRPSAGEIDLLNECVERACEGIIRLVNEDPSQVMNVINRRER